MLDYASGWRESVPSRGLMIGSLATDNVRFRTCAFALSQGLIVAGSLATVTKVSVRRTRPNGENRRSFPSGHAAATFALATIGSLAGRAAVLAVQRVTVGTSASGGGVRVYFAF